MAYKMVILRFGFSKLHHSIFSFKVEIEFSEKVNLSLNAYEWTLGMFVFLPVTQYSESPKSQASPGWVRQVPGKSSKSQASQASPGRVPGKSDKSQASPGRVRSVPGKSRASRASPRQVRQVLGESRTSWANPRQVLGGSASPRQVPGKSGKS